MCNGISCVIRPLDIPIPSPGQIMLAAALYSRNTNVHNFPAISYYPHNPHVVVTTDEHALMSHQHQHHQSLTKRRFLVPYSLITFTTIAIIFLLTVIGSSCRLLTILIVSFFAGFYAGQRVARNRMHF